MNNKPVAWAIKSDNDFTEIGFDDDLLKEIEQMYAMEGWKYEVISLYTHPVKELPTKEDEYWLMVEVLRAKVKEQQAEIEALKDKIDEAEQRYWNNK